MDIEKVIFILLASLKPEDDPVINCCKQNGVPLACMGFCGKSILTNNMTGCYEIMPKIDECQRRNFLVN